jgi:lipopolysaccharide export system permease protein
MSVVEGYIFRMSLVAFLAGLGALTGVIWVTQALRQVDLLTTKGQTLLIFLALTGLTLPSLVAIIAPIAIFVAVLYVLNRLNGDSELVVLSASGLSPVRLLRPFAAITLCVAVAVAFMALWAMPASFRSIRDLAMSIQTDFLTRVVREGQFSELVPGFVFHYRERGGDGALQGIFIQDRRDPDRINTYLAEVGVTLQQNGLNYLVLEKGSVQRQSKTSRDPAMVVFESYAIDLAQFGSSAEGAPLKPRERSTTTLISPDPKDDWAARNKGALRAELHDRIAAPLWALVLGFIGFASMAHPRTTRQGRGTAISGAVLAVLLLRAAGFWATALATRHTWGVWLVYGFPLLGMAGAAIHAFGPPLPEWPGRLARLVPGPRVRLRSA